MDKLKIPTAPPSYNPNDCPSYLQNSYPPNAFSNPNHATNPTSVFNNNSTPVVIIQQPSVPATATSSVHVNVGESEGICCKICCYRWTYRRCAYIFFIIAILYVIAGIANNSNKNK